MAFCPITSWRIEGGKAVAARAFLFCISKSTEGEDSSHEIKRHLLYGRKAKASLDSILKSRDITLLTKVHIVTTMYFPVVMHRCENRIIKKTNHQRIDASSCGAREDP